MARQREPFSILKMKEVFDDCSETLFTAIRKQNPDVSADALDMALRNVVMNYGSSLAYAPLNGVIASIQDAKPQYIQAADILVLARSEFTKGNHEEALKLFILSQDADNVEELFDAMALNNAKSELGEQSEGTPVEADESEENSDEEEDDENWEDTPLYQLSDPDQQNDGDNSMSADDEDSEEDDENSEDDEGDEDSEEDSEDDEDSEDSEDDEEDVMAKVRLVANRIRVKAEEENDSDEPEEDEETEQKDPVEAKRLLRIAANKVSLDGTDKSRGRANQLMKRAS